MSNEYLSSVTAEEAVALLLNIADIPAGKTVFDVTASARESIAKDSDFLNGIVAQAGEGDASVVAAALFERLFTHTRGEVVDSMESLARSLFDAFDREARRPMLSMLVKAPSTSVVPRFTTESVNLWAIQNFGLKIPGQVQDKKERLFYQMQDAAPEASAQANADTSADRSDLTPSGSPKTDGLGKVAADYLYVTMAYLTEMFIDKRPKWFLPDGRINISQTAETIALYIQADPAAKELGGQSVEAIKSRLEVAQKTRRAKVNRV